MSYVTSWEIMAKEEARKEARKEKEKALFDVAKRMLRENLPIDTITRYTGIASKKIEALSKSLAPVAH